MQSRQLTRAFFLFAMVVINIGCDQISKSMVRTHMPESETLQYLDQHLIISRVENSGAFLSMGDTLPGLTRQILLLGLPLLMLAFGIYYLSTKPALPKTLIIGLCCVIGGGAGNLFDRIVHGSVTDFLYIDFYIFHTGIFNLADVSIMTGTGLILLSVLLRRKT